VTRFGLRYAETIIPTVEVTIPEVSRIYVGDRPVAVTRDVTVRRVRGFTKAHAMIRAQRWTRDHGDPR
jgi:hypothetical protein